LQLEKQVLGFYLSGHPIESYVSELANFSQKIGALVPEPDRKIVVAGFISDLRLVNTKSNNRLAIITIEDDTGKIEVTVFTDLYVKVREKLVENTLIVVEGEVTIDGFTNNPRVRAVTVLSFTEARNNYALWLVLKISAELLTQDAMQKIAKILMDFPGSCPVYISYKNNDVGAKLQFGDNWRVSIQDGLLDQLEQVVGEKNVIIGYRK
jgi:DNA polymerase-3 subunit alpha